MARVVGPKSITPSPGPRSKGAEPQRVVQPLEQTALVEPGELLRVVLELPGLVAAVRPGAQSLLTGIVAEGGVARRWRRDPSDPPRRVLQSGTLEGDAGDRRRWRSNRRRKPTVAATPSGPQRNDRLRRGCQALFPLLAQPAPPPVVVTREAEPDAEPSPSRQPRHDQCQSARLTQPGGCCSWCRLVVASSTPAGAGDEARDR